MADSELIKLYSQRILGLAADIPHLGRLDAPGGSARKRAPLCGSVVSVDVEMENGRIVGFAQDVKACALGQASAAILGQSVIGQDRETIAEGRRALAAMLRENGPAPSDPFADLEVLVAARDFSNRHDSILLAFDATLDAIDAAQNAVCA
ncbi:MAG: iron-sulfur cluster assembly scaffold protein [Pseudomonadota bacterium]